MKQIVIISGKGGTGKTILTGSFASLAENAVFADCDVDAADLHLLLKPAIKEKNIFKSGLTAVIKKDECIECGKCSELCRFDAINQNFIVDSISCEGCAFCSYVCPTQAIDMKENESGEFFISETRFGPMVHARLGIGEENSGKLVSMVREKAKEIAIKESKDLIIIDGSPGIGCPVIASITGVDDAIIVTEPTISGLHDAKRVAEVGKHFKVPLKLIVNKFDLNDEITKEIEAFCNNNDIEVLGKIGFDESVVNAMVEGKTVIEFNKGEAKKEILGIWEKLQKGFKKG
ncbi:MAG: ATP-binding protein [candidate division WOR-3 bacterium]